jgi:hypothetical protein
MNWFVFALMTVISWVCMESLHTGQMAWAILTMGVAFLFVGIVLLTAVFVPLAGSGARRELAISGVGMGWPLVAGRAQQEHFACPGLRRERDAAGRDVHWFAGAPIVNAVVAILQHPPQGGLSSIKPQFFLGIVLAAVGGCLVTLYKPNPPAAKPTPSITQSAAGIK